MLSIGEIARLAGVRTSTIRYYEEIHLLPEPRRVQGRRQYDPAILERLSFIQLTQRMGFSLNEIQTLLEHQPGQAPLPELWQHLAQEKLADVERLIEHARTIQRLLIQGLECVCTNTDDCIHCLRARCMFT